MEADTPEIPAAATNEAMLGAIDDVELGEGDEAVDDSAAAGEIAVPRSAWLFVGGWVGLVVAANVGTIVSPSLQKSNPALLLGLSARNRHLLMAIGNDVSPLAYVVVSTVRILAAALVCYGLGRSFGPRALHWFRRFMGLPKQSLDQMEKGFEKASWLLVPFFVGSNIVAMLAGQRPLPLRRYLSLVLVGIAARLALFWILADQLKGPLDAFVRFTTRFQWPLMAVLFGWVILSNAARFRRGGKRS